MVYGSGVVSLVVGLGLEALKGYFRWLSPGGLDMLATAMTDDDWYTEIELEERKKRRGEPAVSGDVAAFNISGLFQDLKDGFSLPKGARIKYAR